MEEPQQVNRYGKIVWETHAMDILRREHCMCLHCLNLKIIPHGASGNCYIADELYEICQKYGNTFMMTRCPQWKGMDEK